MKLRLALFTVVVLSLVLAACGGGDGGNGDPTQPVSDFFKAFEERDAEKMGDLVCKQFREDVKSSMEMIFGFLAMGGEDTKIEIIDLKLEAKDQKDDEAMVTVASGKIKITILGQTQEEDLSGLSEALKVIKEDGKWVMCDDAMADVGGLVP